MTAGLVTIDYLADSVRHYKEGYAIVAIDVIRASTTAITAVMAGHRCFPVPSVEYALPLAARLPHPLLAGELGGNMPYGFDLTNSPAALADRSDTERPVILLSSSGTGLMHESASADAAYIACFRNVSATARHLAERHQRVAVIGAGTRGEFREEDEMCCALVALGLLDRGFRCEDRRTEEIVARWSGADDNAWMASKSVTYLRESGQEDDLEFVRSYRDDLPYVFALKHDEVVLVAGE